MRRFKIIILKIIFASTLLAISSFSFAQKYSGLSQEELKTKRSFESATAISFKLNTFGPGFEVIQMLNKPFSIRLGASYLAFRYNKIFEEIVIDASTKLILGEVNLCADWYFTNKLHLTAGVYYNLNKESITGKPSEVFTVGSFNLQPEEIGSLTITLTPEKFNPYLGIGFGRPISYNNVVSFNFEVGAVYHGHPKVDLSADGMILPTANQENEKIIEHNIRNYVLYPVVTLQLSVKIF